MLAELNARLDNFTPKIDPSDYEDEEGSYDVCIANISPKERRKRLNFGIMQFAVGLVLLAFLLSSGADKVWRLSLFVVFASAAASVYQWRDKT
jgi:hypothetical protein